MTRNRRYRKKFTRLGNKNQKVFYYKRNCSLPPLVAGADGNDSFINYTFSLDDIASETDFTNLYDAYKIKAVKLRFLPYYTQSVLNSANPTFSTFSSVSNLRIYSAVDYNTASTPTSIDSIREYSNCKVTSYTRGHSRYFKPLPQLVASNNPFYQFPRAFAPWMNSTTSSTAYLSLRVGIDTSLFPAASIAPGDVLLRVEAVYYISCKSPK